MNSTMRATASEMLEYVKTAFMVSLQNLPWLSEDTRKAAIYKVTFYFVHLKLAFYNVRIVGNDEFKDRLH
jgi:predicted metalloendopeptidase